MKFPYFADTTERGDRGVKRQGDFIDITSIFRLVKLFEKH
jgi:hypothetical protein